MLWRFCLLSSELLIWSGFLFLTHIWRLCLKLSGGQRSAVELVQFAIQRHSSRADVCWFVYLLNDDAVSVLLHVFLCAFVYSNTNRWQHTPHTQLDNSKCVREERFPPAGAGCVQTRGFIQSCDPALLLLVSYVIPISAMCSPYTHWPEYGNCDQLPTEIDIFHLEPLMYRWQRWLWVMLHMNLTTKEWKSVESWGGFSSLHTCLCSQSLYFTEAAVTPLPHRQCLVNNYIVFLRCVGSLKLKGMTRDQFMHTEEVAALPMPYKNSSA